MKTSRLLTHAAVAALVLVFFQACVYANWDVARQFSITNNPSHGWLYGYGDGPGSAIIPFDNPGGCGPHYPSGPCWSSNVCPAHNGECPYLVRDEVSKLAVLLPGRNSYCAIRWTAPVTNVYDISVQFPAWANCYSSGFAGDYPQYNGAVGAVDCHVLLNDTLLASGIVLAVDDLVYTGTHAIAVGDTVEIWVGPAFGFPDWQYWYDYDPKSPAACDETKVITSIQFSSPTVWYVSPSGNDQNSGTTWSDSFRQVGSACQFAKAGDQIWVAAGDYEIWQQLTLKDGVRLYGGFDGTESSLDQRILNDDNETVIHTVQYIAIVSVEPNAGPETRVDGFTIHNGMPGILCRDNSSPVITNNLVMESLHGGVVCENASAPTIANNRIHLNTADYGAGIWCKTGSSPTVLRNTITDNRGGEKGPAVYCATDSSAIIRSNLITDNTAAHGGSIACETGVTATIANNTIASNIGYDSQYGVIHTESPIEIANNIIAFNGGGISGTVQPALSNNLVYNPSGNNYMGITSGPSDISMDPLFRFLATDDYWLCFDSPAIDTGDSSFVEVGDTDLNGNPRILPEGTMVDIGAYEVDPSLAVPPDTVITAPDAGDGIPATATFVWAGSDPNGLVPLAYSYRLDQNAWSAFSASTTTTLSMGLGEDHTFEVKARNRYGAIDTTPAHRAFRTVTSADLRVSLRTDALAVLAGDKVTYEIEVHNPGLQNANGVIVRHIAPPGMSLAYCSHPYNSADGTISVGSVAVGQTALIRLVVNIDQSSAMTSTVVASADELDPDESNNSASLTIRLGFACHVKPGGDDANNGVSWSEAKRTIQGAMSCVAPGDELWVAAGLYEENIEIAEDISLYGGFTGVDAETMRSDRNWSTNETILDGRLLGTVVTMLDGARLDGFTLRNGGAHAGGGVVCRGGARAICHNKITNNSAYAYGGGIYCDRSSPLISNNLIRANYADEGGGIYCHFGGPSLCGNTIVENTASDAGALYCYYSYPVLRNNIVWGHTVRAFYGSSPSTDFCVLPPDQSIPGSVGTHNIYSDPLLGPGAQLIVDSPCIGAGDNTCVEPGELDLGCKPRIHPAGGTVDIGAYESNPIPPETSITSGPEEGATVPSQAEFTWTGTDPGGLVPLKYSYRLDGGEWSWFSASSTTKTYSGLRGGQHTFEVRAQNILGAIDPTPATRTFNCPVWADLHVWTSANPSTFCVGDAITFSVSVWNQGPDDATNVVITSPLPAGAGFVYCSFPYDPADGRIILGSIARGQTKYVTLVVTGDQPANIVSSMTVAADQEDPDATDNVDDATCRLKTVYHVKPGGSNSNGGLSWQEAKQTVQAGLDAAASGDEVWVAAGTYEENIQVGYYTTLYGGFAGIDSETRRGHRDWNANETILDGRHLESVVTLDMGATIDGFTIRNGSASLGGGGIMCLGGASAISHNKIIDNEAPYGGGIACDMYASPSMCNNLIASNSATWEGGGIYCFYGGNCEIRNNTILDNTAPDGGAIFCGDTYPYIANNILSGNSSGIAAGWDGWPTVDHNLLPEGEDVPGDVGSHNTYADPLLTQDGRLSSGSPCIDAGDNAYVDIGELDLACKPRVCPTGGTVDIGAYEYSAGASCDLCVTCQALAQTAFIGDQMTFSVTVTNNGPDGAESVVVTDKLPACVAFLSASSALGTSSHAGGVVTWNLPSLASGQSAVLNVLVKATARAMAQNSASVCAPAEYPDPNLSNNSASAATAVWAVIGRYNCGGSATGAWCKDSAYFGGTVLSGRTTTPVQNAGSVPQAVYQCQRTGRFEYKLPKLANGNYVVRLHFSENQYFAKGKRVFSVQIEKAPVLSLFDIYAAACASYRAIVREFPVRIADGNGLQIAFVPYKLSPAIAGIEVLQLPD